LENPNGKTGQAGHIKSRHLAPLTTMFAALLPWFLVFGPLEVEALQNGFL
jgi:hypothetical protein